MRQTTVVCDFCRLPIDPATQPFHSFDYTRTTSQGERFARVDMHDGQPAPDRPACFTGPNLRSVLVAALT